MRCFYEVRDRDPGGLAIEMMQVAGWIARDRGHATGGDRARHENHAERRESLLRGASLDCIVTIMSPLFV